MGPYADPLVRALKGQGFGASLLGSALNPVSPRDNIARFDEQKMNDLNNMLKNNEHQLSRTKAQIVEQAEQEHIAKSRLSGLRNLNAFIRADIDKLTSSISQAQSEKQVVATDIAGLERDLADIEAELDQLNGENSNSVNSNADIRQQRNKYRETLSRMDVEIERYRTGYDSLKKRWDEELREEEITGLLARTTLNTRNRDVSPNVFDRNVSPAKRDSSPFEESNSVLSRTTGWADETAMSVPSTYVQRYLSKDFKRHY